MLLQSYPAYKPSDVEWLGDVPKYWDTHRLKNTVFITMGQSQSSEQCSVQKIGLPFLQGCAEFGLKNPAPIQYCRSPAKTCPDGALLLSVRAPVGKINVADQRYGIGRGLCALVSDDRTDSVFLKYLLDAASPDLRVVATGSTYEAVSVGDVGNLRVPLPPLPEQTAIARFLDHATCQIDRYIRTKEKLIALLEEQKQVMIHDAVTGQIDVRTGKPYPAYKPSDVEWLGDVPTHWEVNRNGRLFVQRNEVGYSELPILEVSLKSGVRVRDFDNSSRKQVMSDRSLYKRAVEGDIAYNMMRMWQGAVGVAPVDGLVSPAYVVARPLAENEPRYFEYLFRTNAYKNEVDKYSRGIVKDRNRLYWEDFKQMPSPCPPLNEQILIAEAISRMIEFTSADIQDAQSQIALANEYRTRLIADVVTGKLDVRKAAANLPELEAAAEGNGEKNSAESNSR